MKVWAYVALATILVGAAAAAYSAVYSAGYNKRDAEASAEAIVAQNEAVEKRMADWLKTQEEAEATIVIEEKIVEKIRVVEKEIPVVVEKIVELTPECADLGTDYAELLNQQVRASNSVQGEGT